MSRDDGFAVMDVSSDIVNDPKVRKLFRLSPDHANTAFVAFIATLGESWKAGRRVNITDAWPGYLTFDQDAVDALVSVGLLDRRGLLSLRAWEGWFGIAKTRREAARDRWRRANEKRHADTAEVPRGNGTATYATRTVPSVPTRTVEGEQGASPLEGRPLRAVVDPT